MLPMLELSANKIANKTENYIAPLFALEAAEREVGMAQLAALGRSIVPELVAVVLRPLRVALTHWPEWQQMLPPRAIVARCDNARRAALAVLETMGSQAVRELSLLLQTQDVALRCLTAETLARIEEPEAVAVLGSLLSSEMSQTQQFRFGRLSDVRARLSVGLLITGILLGCLFPLAIVTTVLGMALALVGVLSSGSSEAATPVRLMAVQAVAKSQDPGYVGILAACLTDPNSSVRRAAVHGLTQILPLVRVKHKAIIGPRAMTALLRALDGSDNDLAVAILAAMQQIGDTRALHTVASLIDSPLHFEPVRSAAQTCLPYVKRRIKEAHQAQELLRPVTQQTVVVKELLCPVQEERVTRD